MPLVPVGGPRAPAVALVPSVAHDASGPIAVVPAWAGEGEAWIRSVTPSTTASTYASAWKGFEEWCSSYGLPARRVAGETVAKYYRYCALERGLARGTIGVIAAAIGDRYKFGDVPLPTHHPLAVETLASIAHVTAASKARRKKG